MSRPARIILIGAGWRGSFFARIARMLPEDFEFLGVVCTSAKHEALARDEWKTGIYHSHEAAIADKPAFVIAAVPAHAVDTLAKLYAAHDIPVLFETYCSASVEDMNALYKSIGHAPIQVAEQYPFQPMHLARIHTARSGVLGNVYMAKASCVQNYHMLSVLRRLLGIGMELPTVYGYTRENRRIAGPNRAGDPVMDEIQSVHEEMFLLDYGDKCAIGDYESMQQRSWIRTHTIHVRAERGEILNETVTCLKDYLSPYTYTLTRSEAGTHGNLEGNYLRGIIGNGEWIWRNPYIPLRFFDDEIAIATCMQKMKTFVETGEGFYSLLESFQDQYISLLVAESAAKHQPVQALPQPWHAS